MLENFMTIKELAQELSVNESTVAKWELKDSQPQPGMLTRIQAFLANHQLGPAVQEG
jgi:DNA-binding transcriptional regulator YiaG